MGRWGLRPGYRVPQKKSLLLRAPGLVIGAVAFGAAGGWTASDMLASWGASGGSGLSCRIKGNISIDTGERIFHVPGQKYYEQTKISPQYGERWFCSEFEAWAAGWRKSKS
ncbi:succinoglycan biosynthesis protein exoi [Rhizobium binae]|nr:succinoglycan biosynthesis protein exoi [Rhizobium binae]MBX4982130.1 succinoglycan biosynthesis protein exoi [Rhizobium binae]